MFAFKNVRQFFSGSWKASLFLFVGFFAIYSTAQQPLSYDCVFTTQPIVVDGKLDDAAWQRAAWTSDFIDITGDLAKTPLYKTRVKMLWDDKYLYIGAELQEPDVHAKLTEHDSVIFHDNDFEFFIKPVISAAAYFEFEMNALNTTWDLFLDKPYREGGKADNSWEARGIKSAVAVQGTLNKPEDKDQGWTLEFALPLDSFLSRHPGPKPVDGTGWRINFSRVEHLPGHLREENWVWSPQGEVNMHIPERWGYLRFHKDLSAVQNSIFHPDGNFRVVPPGRVRISSGVIAGQKLSGAFPDLCALGREQRVSGTPVLHVVIGLDGSVLEVTPVSGPLLFQQLAIDAVKTWRYKPYLLNGEPVEVDTTIMLSMQCGA